MGQLGLGVLISLLKDEDKTINAIKTSLNKKISSIKKSEDTLVIAFQDGSELSIWDNGQSSCEHRYMVIDDDLDNFKNCDFIDIAIKNAPSAEQEYGEHEIQFLEIKTSNGVLSIANHNEHNGYYGGFSIAANLGAHDEANTENF
jgi:hypothetical protein